MRRIFMRETKRFYRFISLILVVTLLAGTIPESVYAQNGKGKDNCQFPATKGQEKVSEDDKKNTSCEGKNHTEKNHTEKNNPDSAGLLDGDLQGLDYAVLATADRETKWSAHSLHVGGSVHVNDSFFYAGKRICVDGSLEAGKRILLHTAGRRKSQLIGKRTEQAGRVAMPDLTEAVYGYAREKGKHMFGSVCFKNRQVDVTPPLVVHGDAVFLSSLLKGKGIVYADRDIFCHGSFFKTPHDSKVMLISKRGNIQMSGADIDLNGVIYAPKGTVDITAASFHLNGRIIAQRVRINGAVVNINAGPNDFEMVDFLFEKDQDREKEDQTEEEGKPEDGSDQDGDKEKDEDGREEDEKPEDKAPSAVLKGEETYYREESGICFLSLTDQSYSPDGDVTSSKLQLTYDSGDDGTYATTLPEVTANNGVYHIQAEAVGKYKAKLVVTEQTEAALTDETEIVFEVANKAPSVSGSTLLEKKVTIMGISHKDTEDDSTMEETIKKLTGEGYDVTYKSFHIKGDEAVSLGEKNYVGDEQEEENNGIGESGQTQGENEEVEKTEEETQVLSQNGITLTAQKEDPEDETVSLSWNCDASLRIPSGYRLFRQLNEEGYTSISTWDGESHIRILNVYPWSTGIQYWMSKPLDNSSESPGKGLLDVDSVHFNKFNENPEGYLLDGEGNYKYDVIVFGSSDCNSCLDLNERSYQATLQFIQSGRGVLFGHDTVVQNAAQTHPYLARFAEFMGITFHVHGAYDAKGTKVDVVKEGTLTSYPWKLQGTLDVFESHSSGQYVEGDFGRNTIVWMKYAGQKVVTDDNFFLLTKNSVAMLQSGHSKNMTDDEKKVLANTLCYLKQYTLDDVAKDPTAYDFAAPEITNVDTCFTNSDLTEMVLHLEGKDCGTSYRYFVQSVPQSGNSEVFTSNVAEAETTTGLKGFVVEINENPSKMEGLLQKDEETGEIQNVTKALDDNAYVEIPSCYIGKECYAHIYAVDNASNVSEEQVVKLNTTSQIYDMEEFFLEEADYIVLDIREDAFDLAEQAKLEKALVETGAEILLPSDNLTGEILTLEADKQERFKNHVFPGQTLSFETVYSDEENDPCYEEEITITKGNRTETITTSSAESREEEKKTPEKKYTVSENGIYHITVKVQDDPTQGNDRLSEYRAWSKTCTLSEELVCSKRPVIRELTINTPQESEESPQVTWDAYAPGKEALENQGISKVSLSWKKVGETEWQEGNLSRTPDAGCIYVIKAVAFDQYGIPSLPKAAILDRTKEEVSVGDGSFLVKNQVEILTMADVAQTCKEELAEVTKACQSEEVSVSVREILPDAFVKEASAFQYPQSVRFLLLSDRTYEKTCLGEAQMQKNLAESGATILYIEEENNLTETMKTQILAQKRDAATGMLKGMEVEYADGFRELLENSAYAVRFVAEYENAQTMRTVTKTYAEPFTPKKPGKYNISLQTAPRYASGATGRYQDACPVVSNLYVYDRPSTKTTTTLTWDETDVAKIKAAVTVTKSAVGKENKIETVTFWWKTMEGQWQEGELPTTLTRGATYLLKTIVTDAEGISSYPYVEIISTQEVPVPDVTAPVVNIQSPGTEERIAGPVDILGTITDEGGLLGYTIAYDDGRGHAGRTPYIDTDNKESQKLGAIDFSYLPNGNYTITVTAEDTAGHKTSDCVTIVNAYPLVKLTNVTADGEYVYLHGKKNTINEIQEVTCSCQNGEGGSVTIHEKEQMTNGEQTIPESTAEDAEQTASASPSQESSYQANVKVIREGEDDYCDDKIMSQEEVLFQIPLSQLESGTYTFCAKAQDTAGISTETSIQAELDITRIEPEKPEEPEDEIVTEEISAITLRFERAQITDLPKVEAGDSPESISENTGADSGIQTEKQVIIYGIYTSTHEITEKTFELKQRETGAAVPVTVEMDNGTITLTAKVADMEQGYYLAAGRIKNSYGSEAYATCGFRLTLSENRDDTRIEEENQNPDTFPSISTIEFSEDRTKVNIFGDRAGYENTALTCENTKTGEPVKVTECSDNGIIGYLYTEDLQTGEYRVTLSVYDAHGELLGKILAPFTYTKAEKNTVSDNTVSDNTVSGNDLDKQAPVIEMEVEDEDYIITQATPVTGSIYDETALLEYTIKMVPKGEEEGITIQTGTEEVRDGILATIDPTVLANGSYQLRIEAKDAAENKKTATMTVTVDSRFKVGNMNIGFTDLVAKMSFGSLNLQRFYNSNNKTCGDYGYGWTMGMTGMTLTETNSITEGYEQVVTGNGLSTTYHITQRLNHDVVVDYGNGTNDRFKLTLSPDQRGLVPITQVNVGFACQTSQGVTLEIEGDNSAAVEGGILVWENETNYEAIHYILTTKDGTKVYLTAEEGVHKIVDSMGNEIIVDENGYHGENNQGITLTRNEEGLITAATDGKGSRVSYGYNENKDLVSFTNEAGNQVQFTYDDSHNLLGIIDPMGVATARNEYDETGRLTATIDGEGNRIAYIYDVEGRTQAVTDRRGNTTVYTYDENGNILKTVDALGNTTYNTYDANNNRLTATDAAGNTTSYSYDGEGNLLTVTDAAGNSVTNEYNSRNQITTIRNSDDAQMLLAYDAKGRISKATDNDGNEMEYTYDPAGNLAGISDAIGTVSLYTYDEEGNVTKKTDGNGNETTYVYNDAGKCIKAVTAKTTAEGIVRSEISYIYDASGNIIQTQDGEGRITKTEYDACGRLSKSIDPEGKVTTYSYTTNGELSKIYYEDGTWESFTYDEEGNVLSSTNRLGKTVYNTYDKAGNLIKVKDELGNETTYEYDAAYQLKKVNNPEGTFTEYEYDCLGRNTKILTSDGSTICYTYDSANNITSMTDALGNVTRYQYDNLGNRCGIILPDESVIKTVYDARARIVSQTDASGNQTSYRYDNNNNLIMVKNAHGVETRYSYNEAGELTCVKDGNDNCTYYEYNRNGEITKITRADGNSYSYEYDQSGRLSSVTTYGGEKIKYEYDGHFLSKTIAGEETTAYRYDEYGRLAAVSNAEGEVTYEYDSFGRVIARTTAAGEKLEYGYDAYNRLNRITTSGGDTEYSYDAFHRLERVTTGEGTTSYTYDKNGNKRSQTNANGSVVSYEYDRCNRLTRESIKNREGAEIASYSYTYNKNGQKVTATEEANGRTLQAEYTYDALNRLTKEVTAITGQGGDKQTESIAYTYDAVGNRIKKLQNGIVYQYEYNNLNQLVKETGPDGEIRYQYDVEGNLTSKEQGENRETYTYSVDGKLLSYRNERGSTVAEEKYTYDGEGNRLSKETQAGSGTSRTYYVMDNLTGYSQVTLELDENREVKTIYERGDGLLSIRTGGETKTYLTDGHGDVRYLTDEEGNVTDYYRYSGYGELVEKIGVTENPYLYCGEYYDEGTGLYYLRARYMNPSTGTFISMDSYQGNPADPASLHKYTYAQNNPQMYQDPGGHFISSISMMSSIACNSILSEFRTLNVMGMVGGFTNVILNQVFGTGENIGYAFLEGYATGFGMGMVYIGITAILAFSELAILFHFGVFSYMYFEAAKNITLAIACHSTGADKEALVYSVVAVLCIVGMCAELAISAEITVAGRKGITNIEVMSEGGSKPKNVFPENPDDLLPEIPRNKVTKANGTTSQTIQTSDNIRIRAEQHPLLPGETYNPRHHGVHYHVEYKVDPTKSWNNKNNVKKWYPEGYTPGAGSGFIPGETFPE